MNWKTHKTLTQMHEYLPAMSHNWSLISVSASQLITFNAKSTPICLGDILQSRKQNNVHTFYVQVMEVEQTFLSAYLIYTGWLKKVNQICSVIFTCYITKSMIFHTLVATVKWSMVKISKTCLAWMPMTKS